MKRGRKSKYSNNEITWKPALYIRLSVEDGDKEESNSVTNQKELLQLFIENKDFNDIKYYIDDGYSGTNFKRPAFKQMYQDLEKKVVNTVIVKDLSRLGRNYIDVGKLVEEVFVENDIRFISVSEDIDSFIRPQSVNEINFPLKNLINEEYCRDISTKVKSSFQTLRKNGKRTSGIAPFGYLIDPNDKHHLVIDTDTINIILLIFDLCEKGYGAVRIANELNKNNIITAAENKNLLKNESENKWTSSKVSRILSNRIYCGDLIQNKTGNISYKIHTVVRKDKEEWSITENAHEAIISKERFERIQKIKSDRLFNWNSRIDNSEIFYNILKCDKCCNSLKREKIEEKEVKGKLIKKYAYVCENCNKEKENSIYIKEDELKIALYRSIKYHIDLLKDFQKIRDTINSNTQYYKSSKRNVNMLKKSLSEIEKNKKLLYEDLGKHSISDMEYVDKIKLYFEKENILNEEIKKQERNRLDAKLKYSSFKDNKWIDILEKYQNEKKLTKEMFNDLVDSITIKDEGRIINICYKYQDAYKTVLDYIKLNSKVEMEG